MRHLRHYSLVVGAYHSGVPTDYSAFLSLMKEEARDQAERAARDAEDEETSKKRHSEDISESKK